ncbi:MAG: hypothetical protein KKA62_05510 [Nanoarchaeota archaeon]|nr:hypothetical protein [Nanoarchaeota archaeon]MBU1643536.1 hypothetical protein [Nanoarchaeota archaeon]MBU1977380.1 hypothetical protein [Nanoarchaeota archaeon]
MAKEKKWVKIATLIFLGMMVIGFSVPGFLDINNEAKTIEPRVCQADADCYLLCADKPKTVLCLNNLCQTNSCEEDSFYELEEPIVFFMGLALENEKQDLENRSDSRDIFVKFNGDAIRVYNSNLNLGHILEKVGMTFQNECLVVDEEKYCDGKMRVNGTDTYSFKNYKPKERDMAEILFLK